MKRTELSPKKALPVIIIIMVATNLFILFLDLGTSGKVKIAIPIMLIIDAFLALLYVPTLIVELIHNRKKEKSQNGQEEGSLKEQINEETKRYNQLNDLSVINMYRCQTLTGITPNRYEQVIAQFLKESGYHDVKVTSMSKDFGADIVGTGLCGEKMCAQCKMYNSPIGLKPIQEIVAAKAYYNCEKAIVFATSNFTENAQRLARVNNVKLVIYSDRI